MQTEELDCRDAGWEPGWPEGGKKATAWPPEGPSTPPSIWVCAAVGSVLWGRGLGSGAVFTGSKGYVSRPPF